MAIKNINTRNGFGFKGAWTLTERVAAHPTTLSPSPPGFLYNRKKLSQICQDGVYSRLQGVMCAYLRL